MYVEARKWCQEGGENPGFGDALRALSAVTTRRKTPVDGKRVSQLFAVSADYLHEFERKHELFFHRFEEVRNELEAYGSSISDSPARVEFFSTFVNIGSGPGGVVHALRGPTPADDVYLERLRDWYALARPLTSLARTYLSDVLNLAPRNPSGKNCEEYLEEIERARSFWSARGYQCPKPPPRDRFTALVAGRFDGDAVTRLNEFVLYCDEVLTQARVYLREMLPLNPSYPRTQFPLQRPREMPTVEILGRSYQIREGMFVAITDMRNSTGAPHVAPQLKVRVEDIIAALRGQEGALSQVSYDDSRVIACETLGALSRCVRRLFNGLVPLAEPGGFAGLRIGCTYGPMLFEFSSPENWRDIRARVPMDSADSTIARSARLMGIDKLRWDEISEQGRVVREGLGDWKLDQSLLFLDARIQEQLPCKLRGECREIDILELRGIGKTRCWAIPVDKFIVD